MCKSKCAKFSFLFVLALFCIPLNVFGGNISRVHVFGDSHSVGCFRANSSKNDNFSSGDYIFTYDNLKIPFSIHWLGAKTMHRIGRDGLDVLNIKNYNVLENDVVVFVFGEIDVRCHIGKQRDEKKRALEEVLDALVANYIRTLIKNRSLYNNINCVVMSVVPPTNQVFNESYPFYGPIEDRVNITKQLNSKLQEACLLNDIKFLNIYDIYASPNGAFNESLSDHNVHVGLNQNYPIKESLIKIFT